jgi:hypothetical protein
LARAKKEYTGRRPSTVYTITPKGRRALAAWLESPGGGPSVEYEALLKLAFADHGSLDATRANLAAVREHARAEAAECDARGREYEMTGGPFPERLPVISLAYRYFYEQAQALQRWAEWAESATRSWTGVTPETGADLAPDAFTPDS